jgi:phosphatidylserine synthase 2
MHCVSGAYAAITSFLLFAMIQFRDGPFIRPHPAFWRIILGVNLVYELGLVFLLFQDLDTARHMMTYIDSNLGIPLPEKNYAENCSLTPQTLWVKPSFIFALSRFNPMNFRMQ